MLLAVLQRTKTELWPLGSQGFHPHISFLLMLHLEIFVLRTTVNIIIILNPFIFCKKQSFIPSGPWGHPKTFVSSPLAPPQPSLGPSGPTPWDAVSRPARVEPCLASCPGVPPWNDVLPSLGHSHPREAVLLSGWAGGMGSNCQVLSCLPWGGPAAPGPSPGGPQLPDTYIYFLSCVHKTKRVWENVFNVTMLRKITFFSLNSNWKSHKAVSMEHPNLNLI